jgi:hypothetical protein
MYVAIGVALPTDVTAAHELAELQLILENPFVPSTGYDVAVVPLNTSTKP